jgi:hypothetical protein
MESMNKRVVNLETVKLDEIFFAEHQKVVSGQITEVKTMISDVFNSLKNTDNYLEKYQPFNWFVQMFDVLRIVLDYPTMGKIKEFEQYKLKEMYDTILTDKGDPKLNKKFIL